MATNPFLVRQTQTQQTNPFLRRIAPTRPAQPAPTAPARPFGVRLNEFLERTVGAGIRGAVAGVTGFQAPVVPSESPGLRKAGAFVGGVASFIPALRAAGAVTRGLKLASVAGRGAATATAVQAGRRLPLLEFPVRSGVAAGGLEAIHQTVGALTGQREIKPRSVATQALFGAAVPVAFALPGAALRRGLEAAGVSGRIGTAVGRRLPFVSEKTKGTIAAQFQTPERRAEMMGTVIPVGRILDGAERSGGLSVGLGARHFGAALRQFATTLAHPYKEHAPYVARQLGIAARILENAAVPGAKAGRPTLTFGEQAFHIQPRVAGSRLSPENIRKVADRIASVLSDKYFNTHIAEKEALASLKDLLVLEGHRAPIFDHLRGGMTHYFLGLLNVASAIVNTTALYTNIVVKYGIANTLWALQQYFDKSAIARYAFQKTIGKGFGQMAAQGGILSSRRLAALSTSLFSGGERFMRPVGALAAYRQAILSGANEPAARRLMQRAARTTLFDYRWNMPRLMRSPTTLGDAFRTGMMFYNFPLHQVNFAAGLTIPQFAQFVTNLYIAGGAVAVPGIRAATEIVSRLPDPVQQRIEPRVAERTPYLMAGVSFLERAMADPELQPYIEGPLSTMLGVSLGRRIEFVDDLVTRLMSLDDGPFQQWAKGFANALEVTLAAPTLANVAQLLKVTLLPMAGQRVAQALTTEATGAFTTRAGLAVPGAGAPTPEATARMALGFSPTALSRGRALMGVVAGRERARKLITGDPREELRKAVVAGDDARLAALIRRMVELGYDGATIRRLVREAAIAPEIRLLRETAKPLREELLPLIEKNIPGAKRNPFLERR